MWALLLLATGPWAQAQRAVEARVPPAIARTAAGEAWRLRVDPAPRPDGHASAPVRGSTLELHRFVKGGDRQHAILRAMLLGWSPSESLAEAGAWRRVAAWPGHGPEGPGEGPRDEWARIAAAVLLGREALVCRTPARAQAIREQLGAVGISAPPVACPAFAAWAAEADFDHVEIAFAAPSTAAAGSLFGHFFMLFAWRDAAGRTPLARQAVMTFLADADVDADPFRVVRGLTGGYAARFAERSFVATYQAYVFKERRAIRRWRLRLDSEERRRILAAAWDAKHQTHRYLFFTRNCATLTLRVLNAALPIDGQAVPRGQMGQAPADVLDALAATGRLTPVESLVSLDQEARAAEAAQAAALRALPAHLAGVRSADPGTRAATYAEAARLTDPDRAVALARLLEASAIIEVRLADGEITPALLAAQTARAAIPAIVEPPVPVDEASGRRQAGIERVGTTVDWQAGGPGLRMEGALFDERLGDRRAHGIGAERALTLLRTTSRWTLDGDRPTVAASTTRLLGFRDVEPALAVTSALPGLGWGWSADARSVGDAVVFSGRIGGLLPLARSADFAQHLLLSVDAEPEVGLDGALGALAVLGLEARIGGGDATLFARAEAAPGVDVRAGLAEPRLRAQARGEWAIGRWTRSELRLVLGAAVSRGDRLEPAIRPQAFFGLSVE